MSNLILNEVLAQQFISHHPLAPFRLQTVFRGGALLAYEAPLNRPLSDLFPLPSSPNHCATLIVNPPLNQPPSSLQTIAISGGLFAARRPNADLTDVLVDEVSNHPRNRYQFLFPSISKDGGRSLPAGSPSPSASYDSSSKVHITSYPVFFEPVGKITYHRFFPLQNMFMSGGLFAASGGLATPLPPDYLAATQGMQFALFQWWCPFDLIKIEAFATPPEPVTAPLLNESTPLIGSSDVAPQGGGRRLLSQGGRALARVLCAPSAARRAAEENTLLREARARAHPARRRLAQVNATLVSANATAPANNTSDELPPAAYSELVAGVTDPEGFLTDNISDAADNGG
jgi:hypothetical protein